MAQTIWNIEIDKKLDIKRTKRFITKSIKENTDILKESETNIEFLEELRDNLKNILNDKKKLVRLENKDRHNKKSENKFFKQLKISGITILQPVHLHNPVAGIKLFLGHYTNIYIPELRGIWCCFRKLELLDKYGYSYLGDQYGCLNVKIELEVLIFYPSQGCRVFANVNRILPTGINCKIFNTFNLKIPANYLNDTQEIVLNDTGNYIISNSLNAKKTIIASSTIIVLLVKVKFYTHSHYEAYTIEGSLKPVKFELTK